MTDSLGTQIGQQLANIVAKAKSDLEGTYATREYVDQIISSGIVTRIVDELPATGESGILYLVPVPNALKKTYNRYKEYAYISGAWEDIGSTELNLENYPNSAYITTALAGKLDKNDPSIPTKLSDLTIDAASKFVTISSVANLPTLANASYNTIYLVENVVTSNYTQVGNLVIDRADMLGSHMQITNNASAILNVYSIVAGEPTLVNSIPANNVGNYSIPGNIEKVRLSAASGNINASVKWTREFANNYIKYIKVNDGTNDKWEIIGNPSNVTYTYMDEHYYKKNEIYTSDEVMDAIDGAINIIDGGV